MSNDDTHEIDELFGGFREIDLDVEASARAIERTRRALLEHAEPSVRVNHLWWKAKINRRSFAAVIAVLAIVVALVASSTFYSQSSSTAFAQVREQLDRARTIMFDMRLDVEGKPTETVRQLIRNDGRTREEHLDGKYSVTEQAKDAITRMDVDPAKKTARMTYGFPQDVPQNLFNLIRNMPKSDGALPIDAREIGGQSYPGLLINLRFGKEGTQQMRLRLWFDPKTRLPVYSEHVAEQKLPKDAVPKGAKDSIRCTIISSNFKYDLAIEDSLFALTPPKGYVVTSVGTPPQQRSDAWPAEKLVLTVGEGIGPAKFGMSKEEVLKLLGEPEEKKQSVQHVRDGLPWEWWHYRSQGFCITFSNLPEPGLSSVTCRRGNPLSRDFKGKTTEGIGLGASPEEVRRAFGEPQEEQRIKNGLGTFHYYDKGMMVGFGGGKVEQLQIQRIPRKKPLSADQRKE